jgi:arsenite-transporting ATPase
MDATGAYHRQMVREFKGDSDHIVTPLMRLQDADYTKIILVTLPEATPVSQAAALQDDLRRAKIEPFAWVVNKSLLATDTDDPLLRARLDSERKQMARVAGQTSHDVIVVPWTAEPPVGVAALKRLLD